LRLQEIRGPFHGAAAWHLAAMGRGQHDLSVPFCVSRRAYNDLITTQTSHHPIAEIVPWQ
jgi:hypothetical protein